MTLREHIFEDAAAGGREADKASRRRKAARYVRDAETLLYWTFPQTRMAIILAMGCPDSAQATRDLCHRLYRDIQNAKVLPLWQRRRRPVLIDELRILFTCECALYWKQAKAGKFRRPNINGIGE